MIQALSLVIYCLVVVPSLRGVLFGNLFCSGICCLSVFLRHVGTHLCQPICLVVHEYVRMTWDPLYSNVDSIETHDSMASEDDVFDALCSVALGVLYGLYC